MSDTKRNMASGVPDGPDSDWVMRLLRHPVVPSNLETPVDHDGVRARHAQAKADLRDYFARSGRS